MKHQIPPEHKKPMRVLKNKSVMHKGGGISLHGILKTQLDTILGNLP